MLLFSALSVCKADYQRDLVVSLVKMSIADEAAAVKYLHRALAILESLKETGRLNPVDEPMIPAVKKMIQDLGP